MINRQKHILTFIVVSILVLLLVYLSIYFIQNKTLSQSFSQSTNTKFDHDTQFVRCNLNIFKPEFAFVFGSQTRAHIAFYSPENLFSQSEAEWDSNRTGGTTVYNLPFSQALQMLKKDCSQFKKGNVKNKPNGTYWIYYPYDKQEEEMFDQIRKAEERILREKIENMPPPTKEQIEQDRKQMEENMEWIINNYIGNEQ